MNFSFSNSVLNIEEDGFEGVQLEGEGRKEVLMHVQIIQCFTHAVAIAVDIPMDSVEIAYDNQR